MSELRFHVEWESPGGARGPELRATWSRLRIDVAGEPLTHVEDKRAGSVRDAVYGPLYPLAEWITTNWWPLLYEVASPTRIAGNGYARRHTLSAASEGFALPWLRFQPEGRRIELAWTPRDLPAARVRFLAQGRRYLDHAQVEEAFRAFVSSVVARLEDQGYPDTLLADEWRAIETSDPEEQSFCRVAGSLGCDPYALSDRKARDIIATAGRLPSAIRDEFFASADAAQLRAQANAVHDFIREAAGSDLQIESLQTLREKSPVLDRQQLPWEQGYEFARWLRKGISLKDRLVRTEAELGDVLGVDSEGWRKALGNGGGELSFLDALVATTGACAPRFALQRRSERSRTFTLCRALFEYLHDGTAPAAIVAPIYSERQKRNRAFAAEFLVPAAQLRRKIRGAVITEEQVQELAEEYGTSDLVIRHQIENHDLARLTEWTI